ncbi:MAG TPA: imidazole glycerol phosphate synthase subunit HisH [Woeseiaceae bacterium]
MRVALLDYGIGNLHSLAQAFEDGGAHVAIESDASQALRADALVLPGVGAFGAAVERLAPAAAELRAALIAGHPCLGVCLGMQLLFEESEEGGGPGLGLLPGKVRRLRSSLTPHMGWNDVESNGDVLFQHVPPLTAYFANSYAAHPANVDDVIAWTEYDGERFPSAVRRGRTWGVQFHPEKSGPGGLQLIHNFIETVRA